MIDTRPSVSLKPSKTRVTSSSHRGADRTASVATDIASESNLEVDQDEAGLSIRERTDRSITEEISVLRSRRSRRNVGASESSIQEEEHLKK